MFQHLKKIQSKGEVGFDYSSHNGRYAIGSGKAKFETMWSNRSGTNIYLYNDPPSIEGIAVVRRDIQRISEVKSARSLDFTSRYRTVHIWNVYWHSRRFFRKLYTKVPGAPNRAGNMKQIF